MSSNTGKEMGAMELGDPIIDDWRVKTVDILTTVVALGAFGLSFSPDISEAADTALKVLGGILAEGQVEGRVDNLRSRLRQRNENILAGQEEIKRKGEQIIMLGGDGHLAVDEMFENNPSGMIPILNNRKVAERLFDLFRSKMLKKLFPFYINLGVEENYGTTVVDTPALQAATIRRQNLVESVDGSKLVMLSVGESFPRSFGGLRGQGANEEESVILASRLINQAVKTGTINDPKKAVIIRLGQVYEVPEGRLDQRSSHMEITDWKERGLKDKDFQGGVVCVDTWAMTLNAIRTILSISPAYASYDNFGLLIVTDTLTVTEMPFSEVFGMTFLGSVYDKGSVENVRDYYEARRDQSVGTVELVVEESDAKTLSKIISRDEDEPVSELRGKQPIYMFQSKKAAELARAKGADNIICASELQQKIVLQILESLRTGRIPGFESSEDNIDPSKVLDNIQNWLAEVFREDEIMKLMDYQRRKPDRDYLRQLDAREAEQEEAIWLSIFKTEQRLDYELYSPRLPEEYWDGLVDSES